MACAQRTGRPAVFRWRNLPGDVLHVDSVIWDGGCALPGAALRSAAHGGLPRRRRLRLQHCVLRGTDVEAALHAINRQVIAAMGLGAASPAEFIRSEEDGRVLLPGDCSARGRRRHRPAGGARPINPWAEWARTVVADVRGEPYVLPAGIAQRLCRAGRFAGAPGMAHDTSPTTTPSWSGACTRSTMSASSSHRGTMRVQELVSSYAGVAVDFSATAPPPERPPGHDALRSDGRPIAYTGNSDHRRQEEEADTENPGRRRSASRLPASWNAVDGDQRSDNRRRHHGENLRMVELERHGVAIKSEMKTSSGAKAQSGGWSRAQWRGSDPSGSSMPPARRRDARPRCR